MRYIIAKTQKAGTRPALRILLKQNA